MVKEFEENKKKVEELEGQMNDLKNDQQNSTSSNSSKRRRFSGLDQTTTEIGKNNYFEKYHIITLLQAYDYICLTDFESDLAKKVIFLEGKVAVLQDTLTKIYSLQQMK